MKAFLRVAFASLTLVGCAGMDAGECRGADWYDLGFRDGIYGLQRLDEVYAAQCGRHGTEPDRARYVQGWREGNWEFERRKGHSGVE